MMKIKIVEISLTEALDKEIDLKLESKETQAYIINTISGQNIKNFINESITILYAEAVDKHNFKQFQELADWLLFCKSFSPEMLNHATEDYYDAVAQNSYFTCYRLLKRQWKVFEELADMFPIITKKINAILRKKLVKKTSPLS